METWVQCLTLVWLPWMTLRKLPDLHLLWDIWECCLVSRSGFVLQLHIRKRFVGQQCSPLSWSCQRWLGVKVEGSLSLLVYRVLGTQGQCRALWCVSEALVSLCLRL